MNCERCGEFPWESMLNGKRVCRYCAEPTGDHPVARLKRGWCQDAGARKADGDFCDPDDPEAVAWDILGAGTMFGWGWCEALMKAGNHTSVSHLLAWQSCASLDEVLKLAKQALELLRR